MVDSLKCSSLTMTQHISTTADCHRWITDAIVITWHPLHPYVRLLATRAISTVLCRLLRNTLSLKYTLQAFLNDNMKWKSNWRWATIECTCSEWKLQYCQHVCVCVCASCKLIEISGDYERSLYQVCSFVCDVTVREYIRHVIRIIIIQLA